MITYAEHYKLNVRRTTINFLAEFVLVLLTVCVVFNVYGILKGSDQRFENRIRFALNDELRSMARFSIMNDGVISDEALATEHKNPKRVKLILSHVSDQNKQLYGPISDAIEKRGFVTNEDGYQLLSAYYLKKKIDINDFNRFTLDQFITDVHEARFMSFKILN